MKTIIFSVVGGVLAIIILWVIVGILVGRRKSKKLDQNIKKIKEEKAGLENAGTLEIAGEKHEEKLPEGAMIESGVLEEQPEGEDKTGNETPIEKENDLQNLSLIDDKHIDDFFKDLDNFDKKPEKSLKKRKKKDDFEDFLDKHSYTRRILDKNILKKIQELPPEIKAVVISNIFSRPQD